MEPTSEALRKLAKFLDEPCDARKLFWIAGRLAEITDGIVDSAVIMYCKTKDEKFIKNLKAGKP